MVLQLEQEIRIQFDLYQAEQTLAKAPRNQPHRIRKIGMVEVLQVTRHIIVRTRLEKAYQFLELVRDLLRALGIDAMNHILVFLDGLHGKEMGRKPKKNAEANFPLSQRSTFFAT